MNGAKRFLIFLLVGGVFLSAFGARRGNQNQPSEDPFLFVVGIVPGSVAAELGIKEGDILRAYNGIGVQSIRELEAAKELAEDSVEIIFDREDEVLSFMFPPGQMGVFLEQRLPELEYEPDAVLLEGIGPLRSEDGMSNSFVLSLTRVADFLRDTVDYTALMGFSGAGFRLQMHNDWDISAVLASQGYRCDLAALDALGYEYRYMELDSDLGNIDQVRQAIIESIDGGSPVLGYGLVGLGRWGIITGYQKRGRELVVRAFDSRRVGYTLAESFPSKVYVIEGRNVPTTQKETMIHSFDIAQEMLETEMVGSYYMGLSAINRWIRLLETETFYNLQPQDFQKVVDANAMMYTRLLEDRAFAAEYLNRIAPLFSDVGEKLYMIADLYHTESEYMKAAFDSETDGVVMWAVDLRDPYDWTPQMRMRQISYLRFARVKEDEALKLWQEINAVYNPEPEEEDVPEEPEEEAEEIEEPEEEQAPVQPEELPEGAQ